MKSLVVRFSDKHSKFETTQQRLKDIAEFLGVSQNKAVAYAINQTWKHLDEHEDMLVELEFKRHGVKAGSITYLHAEPDFIERVRDRIAKGIPMPHEDDESLENNFLFSFLSEEQKNQVRSASSALEKRMLKARFLKELDPDEAARNYKATHGVHE